MNDDARVKLRRKMSDHPRQDVLFSSRRIRLRRLRKKSDSCDLPGHCFRTRQCTKSGLCS